MASSTTQSHPVHQPAPDAPRTRRIDLTSTQIGASAGAAVTSAVGASFFGTTGTITGAALGSVISTVAGAVYSRSLENAQTRLRETTTVVVRRTGAGARPGSPATVPVQQLPEVDAGARRQAGEEPPGTQALPVAEPEGPGDAGGEPPRPRWTRRRLLTTAGVAVAGFAIAIGGVSAVEAIKGGPISGGTGGTSLGRVVTQDTGPGTEQDDAPATDPEPTTQPTAEATPDPSESAGTDPTPTADPTGSTGTEEGDTAGGDTAGTGAQPAPTGVPTAD